MSLDWSTQEQSFQLAQSPFSRQIYSREVTHNTQHLLISESREIQLTIYHLTTINKNIQFHTHFTHTSSLFTLPMDNCASSQWSYTLYNVLTYINYWDTEIIKRLVVLCLLN
jgi:hypothetical protein